MEPLREYTLSVSCFHWSVVSYLFLGLQSCSRDCALAFLLLPTLYGDGKKNFFAYEKLQ